ncbi:MAG: GNAT family N-acetyltransferase [Gammaproteobacteria bacterium]|nr:GNAT family N-acetyltransferase [Gammaproteobacteria bacterium]MCP5198822.1 GNAT family N-acetyltransferase [Gammaproteobacteria bacterium]
MSREALEQALKAYPLQVKLNGRGYTIRPMTLDDGDALRAFASALPAHDRLYMRRDLTSAAGMESWLDDIREGVIYSLIALDDDGVAGFSTVHLNKLEWTRHVADIRVATAERTRRSGLGRVLVREGFNLALALDVEKLLARMTPDQNGARVLFEELGFTPEALLKDYVKDRDGHYHDMLLKGCSVREFLARREAYGRS